MVHKCAIVPLVTDDLLTSSQAAALRGITQTSINRAVAQGRLIPAFTVPGNLGARLFRRQDVLDLKIGRQKKVAS